MHLGLPYSPAMGGKHGLVECCLPCFLSRNILLYFEGFVMPLQGSLCGPHGEEDVMEVFILLLILASVVVNGSLKAFACIPSVGRTFETHL